MEYKEALLSMGVYAKS